jgi:hypothetical protein
MASLSWRAPYNPLLGRKRSLDIIPGVPSHADSKQGDDSAIDQSHIHRLQRFGVNGIKQRLPMLCQEVEQCHRLVAIKGNGHARRVMDYYLKFWRIMQGILAQAGKDFAVIFQRRSGVSMLHGFSPFRMV